VATPDKLDHEGSAGVIYPRVRHRAGTCLAGFRPALLVNVRKGWVVTLEFPDAFAEPVVGIDKGREKTYPHPQVLPSSTSVHDATSNSGQGVVRWAIQSLVVRRWSLAKSSNRIPAVARR
jgi:hypothetical protein